MRTVFTFFALMPLASAQCVLAGRVIDGANEAPIKKVRVYAAAGNTSLILTITNENGVFCFAKLNPGDYNLVAEHTGYLDVAYKSSRYMPGLPSIHIANGGKRDAVTLKMTRRPILAGTVVDTFGDPVASAEVHAVYASGDELMRREPGNIVRTDVFGRFRFYDLDPGTYHLIASPGIEASFLSGMYLDNRGKPPSSRQIETYYPATLLAARAEAIELKAASEVMGLTITMQTATLHHVSGRVIGPFRGYLMLNLELSTGGTEGSAIQVAGDGTFRKDGLRPAKYTLRLPGGVEKVIDLSNSDIEDMLVDVGKPAK